MDIDNIPEVVPYESFSHLGTTGVACTQKENLRLIHGHNYITIERTRYFSSQRIWYPVTYREELPMIRVRLVQRNKELSLPGPTSVGKILEEIGAKKTSTVVLCEKKLLTPDKTVENGMVVEVISVVSGG